MSSIVPLLRDECIVRAVGSVAGAQRRRGNEGRCRLVRVVEGNHSRGYALVNRRWRQWRRTAVAMGIAMDGDGLGIDSNGNGEMVVAIIVHVVPPTHLEPVPAPRVGAISSGRLGTKSPCRVTTNFLYSTPYIGHVLRHQSNTTTPTNPRRMRLSTLPVSPNEFVVASS